MKNVDITWSHIMARKLSVLREERGVTQEEIAVSVGTIQNHISSVLSRQRKSNEKMFRAIGKAIGISDKDMEKMILISMAEAIESEYPDARKVFSKLYS